ncbi:MAG TPA: hypothetical protein PK771_11290 [Spirochaetota bacterium]|nr:hypothetical protein [Spirochaetota bacterium]
MDKKFNFLLFFSMIIHLLIITAFIYFISIKKINLLYNDEKKISLSIKQVTKKALLKSLVSKNYSFDLKKDNFNQYDEEIKKNVKIENEVKLNVKNSDLIYQYSNIYDREIKTEEISIFDNEVIKKKFKEEEFLSQDSGYINFVDGNKRSLVNDYKDELKTLNLNFSINCKLKIIIDNNGVVKDVVMIESTGDIEKDSKIINIINRWKFDESNRLVTEAIVELKYLFR